MSRYTPPRPKLRDPELQKMARIATLLGDVRMMGAPAPPLTPQSQQITQQVGSQANSSGAATFTFQAPPLGTTWTGTLSVSNAPTSAVFVASIGATQWGDWGGNSVAGPVQAFGQQQLVVTATGLIANTDYVMTWTGSSDPSDAVGAIWPEPNVSALTAEITGAPPELIYSGTTNMGNLIVAGQIPASTRTLIVIVTGMTTVLSLGVRGVSSLQEYYNQPFYLGDLPSIGIAYIPFNPLIDPTANIGFETTPTGLPFEIYSDTQIYDESLFYNGVAQTQDVTAAGTIVTGPCRILAAAIQGANTGSNGTLALNGNIFLTNQRATQVGGEPMTVQTFPKNEILPAGQSITAAGGVGLASVTYAYP